MTQIEHQQVWHKLAMSQDLHDSSYL